MPNICLVKSLFETPFNAKISHSGEWGATPILKRALREFRANENPLPSSFLVLYFLDLFPATISLLVRFACVRKDLKGSTQRGILAVLGVFLVFLPSCGFPSTPGIALESLREFWFLQCSNHAKAQTHLQVQDLMPLFYVNCWLPDTILRCVVLFSFSE